MDVLAELSYVSMTPDHFPSMFCKVGRHKSSSNNINRVTIIIVVIALVSLTVAEVIFNCLRLCLQEMSVGYANGIRVMSMTHTGEPGFMLYIPIEVHTHTCTNKR